MIGTLPRQVSTAVWMMVGYSWPGSEECACTVRSQPFQALNVTAAVEIAVRIEVSQGKRKQAGAHDGFEFLWRHDGDRSSWVAGVAEECLCVGLELFVISHHTMRSSHLPMVINDFFRQGMRKGGLIGEV